MRYTQLTREERYQIYILKKTGHKQQEIAQMLQRDKSTISRELRRNKGFRSYRPKQAHDRAVARRFMKTRPRIDDQVWQGIETLIRQEWSPEQSRVGLRWKKGCVSAMSGYTSMFMQTNVQAETCTAPCVAKRCGASAMVPMTGAA